VRLLAGSRAPVLALAFLSPTIAEFMTGSTSVTTLFYDPVLFLIQLAFLLGLYGGGVLLIRELAVARHKGWATILLLGAAYGIAEEGLAVHTFFEVRGPPVGALATYGAAFGVDWLWALAITVFHATYSIALPILIVRLWWPETRAERWFDAGGAGVIGLAYVGTVAIFALTTGHGPSPPLLLLFVALAVALIVVGDRLPEELLATQPGPARWGSWGAGATGSLGFIALLSVYFFSASPLIPAIASAFVFLFIDGSALFLVLHRTGRADLESTEFSFAVGMIVVESLFALLILPGDPAVALVLAGMAVLLYRLRDRLAARNVASAIPKGALGG
jgi:hypothetical protein